MIAPVEHICHHFWVGETAIPPKSDDTYAQLTRGAFIINDFLQNPHFSQVYVWIMSNHEFIVVF